ncbi:uncharacterized protein LOC144099469 isoform X2 [Amblyomma americanum]
MTWGICQAVLSSARKDGLFSDEAFKLLFFAHFAFNIQYQKETSLCLEFTQRAIAGINPARGTKVQKNGGKQHCLSPRVAALATALKDYDF